MNLKPRCIYKGIWSRNGFRTRQCTRNALVGDNYCFQHSETAFAARKAKEEARVAAKDEARQRLLRRAENYRLMYQALRDISMYERIENAVALADETLKEVDRG